MKRNFLSLLILIAVVFASDKIFAQQDSIYAFDKKIAVTGNDGYDYLAIDTVNRRLYVSHGTQVNVIDLNTEQVIGSINNMKGVHGTAIVNDVNRGFISDGKGDAVIAFDLKTLKTIAIKLTINFNF